jgi:hypothetical protein
MGVWMRMGLLVMSVFMLVLDVVMIMQDVRVCMRHILVGVLVGVLRGHPCSVPDRIYSSRSPSHMRIDWVSSTYDTRLAGVSGNCFLLHS